MWGKHKSIRMRIDMSIHMSTHMSTNVMSCRPATWPEASDSRHPARAAAPSEQLGSSRSLDLCARTRACACVQVQGASVRVRMHPCLGICMCHCKLFLASPCMRARARACVRGSRARMHELGTCVRGAAWRGVPVFGSTKAASFHVTPVYIRARARARLRLRVCLYRLAAPWGRAGRTELGGRRAAAF